jgi:hypothetical protein
MKKISSAFALALAAMTGFAAAAGHAVEMHGLRFAVTPEFSAPEAAGLDALRVVLPKDARPGAEKMSITAVRFPAEAVGAGGMSDAELLDYVKTAFLAATGAGKPVERIFLAQKARGEALEKSIPVPARAEAYVVALKTGDKIVFAFAFVPEFAAEAGRVIDEAAESLRE